MTAPREHGRLSAALPAILDTPMAPPGGASDTGPDPRGGVRLRDLGRAQRLDELAFDLRLGAGTGYVRRAPGPGGADGIDGTAVESRGDRIDAARLREAVAQAVARVEAEGRAKDAARLGYLRHLLARTTSDGDLAPVLPRLAGVLTGFIDLTFRVPFAGTGGGGGTPGPADWCYFVCDYKTNRIVSRARGGQTRPHHYTRPWMAWEMSHHGYHLQALLYQVALHRLLRSRLRDAYDPARHLGGHVYLFLRGMTGPGSVLADGTVRGVYRDRFSTQLILDLDAALSGGVTRVREERGGPR